MDKKTVYIVEDNQDVSDILRSLFEEVSMAVEVFTNGPAFLARYQGELGCLVLDLRLPGMSGLKVFESVLAEGYRIPTVFLTGHGDVAQAVKAIKMGAVDFLTKPFIPDQLLDIVQTCCASPHAVAISDLQSKAETAKLIANLTRREKEVFACLSQGGSTKKIARFLNISPHTIDVHRAHLMRKMKVKSVGALIHMVYAHDMLSLLPESAFQMLSQE